MGTFYFGLLTITALFALSLVVYFRIKGRGDMAWSLIPFLISIGIFAWAAFMFFKSSQNTSPK